MAYLARIETHTAQPVALLPRIVAVPTPAPPAPDFSALEWSVIRLARVDGLSTLRTPGRLVRFINWLVGRNGNPDLANPQLVANVMRTLFPRGRPARVVELRRRDRTAHAISYARALLSGIWRKEQEPDDRPEPAYSPEAMARAGQMIEQQEGSWQAMYRDLRVEPLVIWYEDVLENPAGAVQQVAGHLEVTLDPGAALAVPAIERQSQAGARAWAQHHEAG